MRDFDGVVIPDTTEPIMALRSFAVVATNRAGPPDFKRTYAISTPPPREGDPVALAGPAYRGFKYSPGENIATCSEIGPGFLNKNGWARFPMGYTVPPDSWPQEHRIAGKGYGCGFYAYYDGSNNYYKADTVAGVVQAYGHVNFGDRGLRCSKLRIVALVNPHLGFDQVAAEKDSLVNVMVYAASQPKTRLEKFMSYCSRKLWPVPAVLLHGSVGCYLMPTALLGILFSLLMLTGAGILLLGMAWWRDLLRDRVATAKKMAERTPLIEFRLGGGWGVPRHVYRALEESYPDVKWYATEEEMLKDFPLTQVESLYRMTDGAWRSQPN